MSPSSCPDAESTADSVRLPSPKRAPRLARATAAFGFVAVFANSCGVGVGPLSYTEVPYAAALTAPVQAEVVATTTPLETEATTETAAPSARPTVPSADLSSSNAINGAALDAYLPDTVETTDPRLLLRPAENRAGAAVIAAQADDDISYVAPVGEVSAHFVVGDVGHRVKVLAVDPFNFRPLTPDVTAQAPAVWERLIAGDVLVRHDIAHEFGLELGGVYPLKTDDGGVVNVRIGALASNGAPPYADVIVNWTVADRLGDSDVDLLLLSVKPKRSLTRTARELRSEIGAEVEVREAASQQTAQMSGSSRSFEAFAYTDLGDGMIVIDPAWVQRNIVLVDLKGLGRTRVHRLMAPQLLAAIDEVEAAGLLSHFDPSQFAGGWVPRHIDWSPTRPLSMHAWGLAVDINSRDNCLRCNPKMDMQIVNIFEKWGFTWGGRWSRPDGMHFELSTLVTPT